jgi:lysophospholipase L1-like esterase
MASPRAGARRTNTERSGMTTTFRRTLALVGVLALTAGCGSSSPDEPASPADATASPGSTAEPATDTAGPTADAVAPGTAPETDAAPVTELRAGPVSVIALGDSLTAGDGDDLGLGFVGRLTESIDVTAGRSGSSLANFGISGWHSTGMVDGQDGAPGQLGAALAEVEAAVAAGRAVLATVLIGSNDLWYLYDYGSPEGTTPAEEDAAEETYRSNVDRAVRELSQAGAVVVLGLPDDQSLRPCSRDIDYLNTYLPNVTVEEVQQMSAMSERLARVVEEVAAAHGVRTVDTNAPFWADESTMNSDLIHPNADGYATLADLWFTVIQDLL